LDNRPSIVENMFHETVNGQEVHPVSYVVIK